MKYTRCVYVYFLIQHVIFTVGRKDFNTTALTKKDVILECTDMYPLSKIGYILALCDYRLSELAFGLASYTGRETKV